MRERLSSGAAVDALFPADPTRNAPAILNTLGAIFPCRARLAGRGADPPAHLGQDRRLGVRPGRHRAVHRAARDRRGSSWSGGSRPSCRTARRSCTCGSTCSGSSTSSSSSSASTPRWSARTRSRSSGSAATPPSASTGAPSPYAVLTVGGFYPGFNPAPAVLPPLPARLAGAPAGHQRRPLDPGRGVLRGHHQLVPARRPARRADGLRRLRAGRLAQLDAIVHFSPFAFHLDGTFGLGRACPRPVVRRDERAIVVDGPGPVTSAPRSGSTSCSSRSRSRTPSGSAAAAAPRRSRRTCGRRWSRRSPAPRTCTPRTATTRTSSRHPGPVVGMALLSPLGRLVWSQTRAPLAHPIQKVDGVPLGADAGPRTVTQQETSDGAGPRVVQPGGVPRADRLAGAQPVVVRGA